MISFPSWAWLGVVLAGSALGVLTGALVLSVAEYVLERRA